MGFEARWILDFTDHVWTEFRSESGRWVHCDPCEDQLDTPLLYTNGWGKKLSYVLGFSVPEGPVDVSRRYLGKKFDEASVRRTEVGEDWLQDALEKGRQMVWTQCAVPVAKIASLRQQLQDEDLELQVSSLRPNIPGF